MQILREIPAEILSASFFTLMADEATVVSNCSQLVRLSDGSVMTWR